MSDELRAEADLIRQANKVQDDLRLFASMVRSGDTRRAKDVAFGLVKLVSALYFSAAARDEAR